MARTNRTRAQQLRRFLRDAFGMLLLVGGIFFGWGLGALPFIHAQKGFVFGSIMSLIGFLIVLQPAIDGGRRGWQYVKAALMVFLGSIIIGILVGALANSYGIGIAVLCAGVIAGLIFLFVAAKRAAHGVSNIFTKHTVVAGAVVDPDFTGPTSTKVTHPDVTGLTGSTDITRPDGVLRPDRRSSD